jgi:hypothetical protein
MAVFIVLEGSDRNAGTHVRFQIPPGVKRANDDCVAWLNLQDRWVVT